MALSPQDLGLTTLRNLSGSWARSGLTTLGIFMGVAAVNVTLNIETISTQLIQQKLNQRDNPFMDLWLYDPNETKQPPKLSEAVLNQLEREVDGIADISQITWVDGRQIQYRSQITKKIEVFGVSANYQTTTGRKILAGRFFEPIDFEDYRPVAIIDEVLAEALFESVDPPVNPLGESIFLDGTRLVVIGISESKNNQNYEKPVGTLWVSESYGRLVQGDLTGGSPQISLRSLESYARTKTEIETLLSAAYPDFAVYFASNAEDLYQEEQQQKISSNLLKFVSLLALVIGGVGIANITVATVVERTKEIGLRRALGATDLEVMMQFITEAAILSCLGGASAIIVVHIATSALTNNFFDTPYQFRLQSAVLSMSSAFVVGVGASFFPALRVTQIDVVQALRGE